MFIHINSLDLDVTHVGEFGSGLFGSPDLNIKFSVCGTHDGCNWGQLCSRGSEERDLGKQIINLSNKWIIFLFFVLFLWWYTYVPPERVEYVTESVDVGRVNCEYASRSGSYIEILDARKDRSHRYTAGMSMDKCADLKATLKAYKRVKIDTQIVDDDLVFADYIVERRPIFYLYFGKHKIKLERKIEGVGDLCPYFPFRLCSSD
ncbi:hypothetical protein HYN76_14315 [Vibrio parahaemolyticus]|uniref:hypothetical protein n=1 Tax=Vibrio parahaemolyticus TaxID=670 RepID=UPI000A3AC22D|nr:hypothetical protein [Vibrio parahaemolyticus]MBM5090115.1 hypothetical protein [Vibrio parahaemolyticus]MBM5183061.1 hypothetical protein [Vibrio parahaemolyticus]OUD46936.1 hypothetical protein BS624_00550 [Vibrio parahaemolyticus]